MKDIESMIRHDARGGGPISKSDFVVCRHVRLISTLSDLLPWPLSTQFPIALACFFDYPTQRHFSGFTVIQIIPDAHLYFQMSFLPLRLTIANLLKQANHQLRTTSSTHLRQLLHILTIRPRSQPCSLYPSLFPFSCLSFYHPSHNPTSPYPSQPQ